MKKFKVLFYCLLLMVTQAIAQTDRLVTGQVKGENNNLLSGVVVSNSSGNNNVLTNASGQFSIRVKPDEKSLKFSFVGYVSQEIDITKGNNYQVQLVLEDKSLDEVVVVGYGTTRKRNLTGSIATVSGEKIKNAPVQSFDQALSGRAAGVSITIPNGVVNNPPVIRVRGVNSIGLSSFPLVVVDGIPVFTGNVGTTTANNVLGDINPSDIESIEVLKDASAAAIYGSRASAGVLLLTTKKGKQGKAKVTYDTWVGYTSPYNLVELLNGREYELIKNEALTNLGTPPNGTTRGFYPYLDKNGNPVSTNWYDVAYQNGKSHSHNISVAGANEKTNYYFSAGYTNQEGIIRTNSFSRLSANMNLEHKINSIITVGNRFQYASSFNRAPNTGSVDGAAFNTSGIGRLAFNLAPNVPVFLNDGSYNINSTTNSVGQGANLTPLQFTNMGFLLDKNKFSSANERVIGSVFVNFKLNKYLNLRTTYGIDNLLTTNKIFQSSLHGDGVANGGNIINSLQTYKRKSWQNTLNFDKDFGSHNVNLLLGNEQQSSTSEAWGANRQGVADPFFDEYQGGWNSIVPLVGFLGENYLTSFFGRINYDYDRKYLISVNARRDGYSAFAPENKYGNFWGASAGWVMSKESFFAKSGIAKLVSNLKLRASYGIVGNNQGIGDFAFWSFYNSGLYGANPTLIFSQAGNRNLSWETSKKTDIGLELGLLNNRINVEATYYLTDINNLILDEPQAPSRGIPGNSILTNIGSMTNKGLELVINANVIDKKNFSWNTSFNITTLKNKVTTLAAGNADIQPATSGSERPSMIRVGESIGSFYAVRTGGVNPANGQRIFFYRDGTAVQYNHENTGAARWTYVSNGAVAPRAADQANDGVIIGPALPKYTGGWENTFRFNQFDVNFLFFFSGGNYVYNGSKAGMRDMRSWNNAKEVLTRWQKAGDVTNIPRAVFGDNVSNGSAVIISENVEKGDFIKLRNFSIGYTLSKKITDKIGISNARFYVQGQNLVTLTKYSGYDPEISSNGNGNGNPSVDRNSVPMARSINVGLTIGF